MSLILEKLDDVFVVSNKNIKFNPLSLSKKFRRQVLFSVFTSLFLLSLNFFPNFFDPFSDDLFVLQNGTNQVHVVEDREYQEELSRRFTSVDAIVYYVRKHVPDQNDKRAQLELLTNIIRRRFHHAYSIYGMHDNWIAALAGKFIWRDLAAKVIPDDILKDPNAACSQVSIVLMQCCQALNIPYRKVGLNGHYAMEAMVQGKWYYADANLKPDFSAIGGRKSLSEIIEHNELYRLYANTILKDSTSIAQKFSIVEYGQVNAHPAPRAHVFHVSTKFFSKWIWLFPLMCLLRTYRKNQVATLL